MRSGAEIAFRLRQEITNLYRYMAPPRLRNQPYRPLPLLPDPDPVAAALRNTKFAEQIEMIAESVLHHRIPLLGLCPDLGNPISWRRDFISGRETDAVFFRRIPYLDAEIVGDHKNIWELNRHQHLVLLAQAYLFTHRREFLDEIVAELESWMEANPFARGINWASALEVAFRALSWVWVYHLTGRYWSDQFHQRFITAIYQHGYFLNANLSTYFSPNTHLLGELVALHAIGALFSDLPRAEQWRRRCAASIERQMEVQVQSDGVYFEQSTYYHVYALDFFLFHAVLENTSTAYREKLARMADFLEAVHGPARTLPVIGDDDGGRLFHPYGARDRFGRATLATASLLLKGRAWSYELEDLHEQACWWLGEQVLEQPPNRGRVSVSSRFSQSGFCILTHGGLHVIVDAGSFGPGNAGHSHSDTLSIVVRDGDEELLVDAGTYTYVGDPTWRNWFRGSAAHNTIRIDGMDQATPCGPFRWTGKPVVELSGWAATGEETRADAVCCYAGFRHRRELCLKDSRLTIVDRVEGPAGEHEIEQFWHCGGQAAALGGNAFQIGSRGRLTVSNLLDSALSAGGEYGWRSRALGAKEPNPVIRARAQVNLPISFTSVLSLVYPP